MRTPLVMTTLRLRTARSPRTTIQSASHHGIRFPPKRTLHTESHLLRIASHPSHTRIAFDVERFHPLACRLILSAFVEWGISNSTSEVLRMWLRVCAFVFVRRTHVSRRVYPRSLCPLKSVLRCVSHLVAFCTRELSGGESARFYCIVPGSRPGCNQPCAATRNLILWNFPESAILSAKEMARLQDLDVDHGKYTVKDVVCVDFTKDLLFANLVHLRLYCLVSNG